MIDLDGIESALNAGDKFIGFDRSELLALVRIAREHAKWEPVIRAAVAWRDHFATKETLFDAMREAGL